MQGCGQGRSARWRPRLGAQAQPLRWPCSGTQNLRIFVPVGRIRLARHVLEGSGMTIIAAVDFSPTSLNAARNAALLAKMFGDTLLLVRTVQPPALLYPELAAVGVEALETELRRNAATQLEQAAKTLAKEGAPVQTRVLSGVPEQALADCARTMNARMIVMGTHGRRAAARFFLGSVAERMVRAAPCPVLVLHEGSAPFESWAKSERPLRVMLAVDLSASSDAAVAWIGDLRKVAPCDVVLVHNYWPPHEYTRLGLHGPRDVFETDPEIVAVLERDLRARFSRLPGMGTVTVHVRAGWGRTADSLAIEAQAERADLLVTGTHQAQGWDRVRSGSNAIATLRSTHIPVLAIPLTAAPAVTKTTANAIPTIHSVLAATDFSPVADAAVAHAYSLLRGTGGVVELCHVRERVLPTPIYAYEDKTDALTPDARAALEGQLRALIPTDAEALGITTHVVVIDGGTPAEALGQAAERLGVDAVSIASHGRSGVSRAVVGSVAESLLRRSVKPVFVVRGRGD